MAPPSIPRPPVMPMSPRALSDRIDEVDGRLARHEEESDRHRQRERSELAALADRVTDLERLDRDVRRRVNSMPDGSDLERSAREAALRAVEDTGVHRVEELKLALDKAAQALRTEVELTLTKHRLDSVRVKAEKAEEAVEKTQKSDEKKHDVRRDRHFEVLKVFLTAFVSAAIAFGAGRCNAHATTTSAATLDAGDR